MPLSVTDRMDTKSVRIKKTFIEPSTQEEQIHILNLNKIEGIEIIQSMISDQNRSNL